MIQWPEIDERGVRTVAGALYSKRWAVATPPGPVPRLISRAEAALASRFGCAHAVMTCNGSAAIVLALQALGIGPKSRVLVPACTWIGCITSLLRLGAEPVICDAGATRLVPEPTAHPSGPVDAVLAIPLYSEGLDPAAVRRAHPNAKIIFDLSHISASRAIGAPLKFADAIVSSFQASKVLTCGEGGFVGLNDADIARTIEALRTDGRVLENDELWPHGRVHGANYAPSEISAALLLDQLERLSQQSARRADGSAMFLEGLRAFGLSAHFDTDVIADGLHYGVPVAVSEDPDIVVNRVLEVTAHRLMRCYPALAEGPLFNPSSERRYRGVVMNSTLTPNAKVWHERCVIVPHEALLASRESLLRLAGAIAGERPAVAPAKVRVPAPPVTVVVLTRCKRRTLDRALRSVAAQDYDGEIQILLVCDQCDAPSCELPARVQSVRIDLPEDVTIARVAKLRDMAIRLVSTPLLCFLDDDNWWDINHLTTLFTSMEKFGAPAVHSWRCVHGEAETTFDGSYFPWLDRGTPDERGQYQACVSNGIITPGEAVVRDTARIENGGAIGMVDLGSWLLRTELAQLHGFRAATEGTGRPKPGVGEDDILLAQLVEANTLIACSYQSTLHYQLGGFSNAPNGLAKCWGEFS